ncbi:MAG TPA: FxLYD domain-containing protein, partial [Bryobacteraceae bacterium]
VEAPHVRIVDMHPLSRAEGVVVMGELLNEDVVPAFVSVKATLVTKAGETLDSEGSFDMISHTLLPKQVTPFIIHFPGTDLSKISTINMEPTSVLVSASADPVVEIENQRYQEGSGAAVTGQLTNQSGHTVNVSHVLTTFYDANGQVVWVGGQYIDRALQPQTPVDFRVPVPQDLAGKVKSERTVVSTYIQGNS